MTESGWTTKGENPIGFQCNSHGQYNRAGNWGPDFSRVAARQQSGRAAAEWYYTPEITKSALSAMQRASA